MHNRRFLEQKFDEQLRFVILSFKRFRTNTTEWQKNANFPTISNTTLTRAVVDFC